MELLWIPFWVFCQPKCGRRWIRELKNHTTRVSLHAYHSCITFKRPSMHGTLVCTVYLISAFTVLYWYQRYSYLTYILLKGLPQVLPKYSVLYAFIPSSVTERGQVPNAYSFTQKCQWYTMYTCNGGGDSGRHRFKNLAALWSQQRGYVGFHMLS